MLFAGATQRRGLKGVEGRRKSKLAMRIAGSDGRSKTDGTAKDFLVIFVVSKRDGCIGIGCG